MESIFPDEPGASGALVIGWRRRPGSAVGPDNIESVVTVVFKRSYSVDPSSSDPTDGSLTPRADGPPIFEADFPGNFLTNGDFADGVAGWSSTGGAEAEAAEGAVVVNRAGGIGDLRRNANLGRSLRDRGVGLTVKASADEALNTPAPRAVAGFETAAEADGAGPFPPSGEQQPVILSDYGRFSAAISTESVSVQLPTLDTDGDSVTYSNASLTAIEYENDMAAFKPEADLIVIADATPLPISLAVNGTVRMSQNGLVPQELTGLGWEERFDTPRESDGGEFDVDIMTQPLPDVFQNRYYNGYRRDRVQGTSVPYPDAAATVTIERDDGSSYGFALPSETLAVQHAWFAGTGVDDPCLWMYRRVPMNLDTLVIEPDRNHAYGVWRAAWPVDIDPDGNGPIPFENNRRAAVLVEGA